MPIALFAVIWGLWMGLVFGPHKGEKAFLDKDTTEVSHSTSNTHR